jgi:hypothetical protein
VVGKPPTTTIVLTWSDNTSGPSQETGFQVLRQRGTAPAVVIATLPPDKKDYEDTALEPNTTYSYTVVAVRGDETSLPSDPVSARTKALVLTGVSVSPARLRFESQMRRASGVLQPVPRQKTVTVRNRGDSPVRVAHAVIRDRLAQFSVKTAAPIDIAPHSSASITIEYAASRRGRVTATLVLTATGQDGHAEVPLKVRLSGVTRGPEDSQHDPANPGQRP